MEIKKDLNNVFSYEKKNIDLLEKVVFVSSYCETVGFFNSFWEFNYGMIPKNLSEANSITNLIIENYYFYGASKINLKKLNSSDDTILTLATISGIINKSYRKGLLQYYDLLNQEKRMSGNNTLYQLDIIKKNNDKYIKYLNGAGGNGACIRTAPIGILFNTPDEIILHSFINSIQTHNQVLGYLGGIAVALITHFAKNKINPEKWFEELIKMESKIDEIILNSEYLEKDIYLKKKHTFWNKIKDYQEFRVNKIFKKQFEKNIDRFKYLSNLLRPLKNFINLGASGIEAVILSYEAILLSLEENTINFEKLIYYGVLHFGDNDSTGAIIGAWFGTYQNIIPNNIKIKDLEFYQEIKKLINKL